MGEIITKRGGAGIEDSGNTHEHAHQIPTADNGRLVSAAYRFEVTSDRPIAHPAVPELGVTFVASTHGPLTVIQHDGTRIAGTMLAFGPTLTPRTVLSGNKMQGTHLTLTPTGVRELLGVTMAELANKVVDVRQLPTNIKLTEEHPTGFRVPARRHSSAATSDIAQHWWSNLGTSPSPESLDDLAARVGVSSRHIRYLIALEFGLSPKGWQRLARYHRAQRLVRGGQPLARAAAEAGYADQPHLQREWRTFALQTPAASMRSEYLAHTIG